MVVSIENTEHYAWGENSDGWHLVKREEMSIIQERVPAGGEEVMHYHKNARQFFYILEGEGTMALEAGQVVLHQGEALEIPPQTRHQFRNRSGKEVCFLVISIPSTTSDRANC